MMACCDITKLQEWVRSTFTPNGSFRVIKHLPSHRKLKDVIDPNMILIDASPLLNTEIDNIDQEFKKLLNKLKNRVTEDPDDEDGNEDLEGTEYKHDSCSFR